MESFEPQRCFEHIDKLTYEIGPRLAGRDRSKRASDYIKDQFDEYGLETQFQNFEFVDRVTQSKVRSIILLVIFISLPISVLFLSNWIALSSVLGAYLLYYLLPHLMPKKNDKNVIATMNSEKKAKKRIYIGAHYDSAPCVENKKWGYFRRLVLPFLFPAFLIISVSTFFVGDIIWATAWAILAPFYLFVGSVPFLVYEDLVSPGADDNSSGTSVLLEIARVISESKPKNTEVVFVALGAEEQGLIGSKNFSEEFESPDFFLNLDSLGSGDSLAVIRGNGILRKRETSERLNKKISEREDMEEVWTPFSGHDHIPFIEKGIEATTLTSTNVYEKDSFEEFFEKYFDLPNVRIDRLPQLHTLEDDPEKIKIKNIDKSSEIVLKILKEGTDDS